MCIAVQYNEAVNEVVIVYVKRVVHMSINGYIEAGHKCY